MFEIKIDVFEGPLDLLLQLIMDEELEIYDVPIAAITSSYLKYLEKHPRIDLEDMSEFLVIASTLLLIKARSLLAGEEDFEEAEEVSQAMEKLIHRLVEYNTFSNASKFLEKSYIQHGRYFSRMREIERDYSTLYPDPFEGVSIEELARSLGQLLVESVCENVDLSHITSSWVSVEEQMEKIQSLLRKERQTTFSRLVETHSARSEVVATFLAILLLYKDGEINLFQKRPFAEIEIRRLESEESNARV
ncbi:MAG: segregation/condensation protein A [Actinomycetota bacterium]|nr:segregation/condensation protein A [Actinomycetota bacterium]